MQKLCPTCEQLYSEKWDVCPLCNPQIIPSTIESKNRARDRELNSGVQEKLDFGGIKLVPEKPSKWGQYDQNPFWAKPSKDYTEYKTGKTKIGQGIDIVKMDDLVGEVATEITKKSIASINALLKDYTEYKDPFYGQGMANPPKEDDESDPLSHPVKTPYEKEYAEYKDFLYAQAQKNQ
jgi:hypothetical protein